MRGKECISEDLLLPALDVAGPCVQGQAPIKAPCIVHCCLFLAVVWALVERSAFSAAASCVGLCFASVAQMPSC